MGFRSGAWAKIWEITPGERSTKMRVSISKKSKQTGEYEQDFSGFITLAGTAHRDAGKLKEGDRFQIGDCDVSNRYDKEKKVTYTNYLVFSFKETDGSKTHEDKTPSVSPSAAVSEDSEDEQDLPF